MAVNELFGGGDQPIGLIAVRRVAAVGQLQQLGARQAARDAADLLQRAVFVVDALDREHRQSVAAKLGARQGQAAIPASRW